RVSPRVGVVYDLTGRGTTIVRGGWGIFYDRPQGNQVFDMITNAPGVLNSRVDFGQLQTLTAGGNDPFPTLGLNPSAFGFRPPRVNQWNVGIQHKVWSEVILDVAYVGSTSSDLLRQVQINALPLGATFQPQNQDPTRVPSATLGSTALPNDFQRPHNVVLNSIYQMPEVTSNKALGVLANNWQLSGVYRWTSGRPYGVGFSIPGIGQANLAGNDGNPGARIVLLCNPGSGWSSDPY